MIIDRLQKELKQRDTSVETLHEKTSELLEENRRQSETIQQLNRQISELEVNHKEALNRITALQKLCGTYNSSSLTPGSHLEPKKLQELCKLTHELSITSRELRSTVNDNISEIRQVISQTVDTVLMLKNTEAASAQEIVDLRSLYKKEALEKKLLYNKLQEICGNIRVFCRCRQDSEAQTILEFPSDEEIVVDQNGNRKRFSFDRVYPPTATQVNIQISSVLSIPIGVTTPVYHLCFINSNIVAFLACCWVLPNKNQSRVLAMRFLDLWLFNNGKHR